MTVTILYLNPCRRERLRDAFAMNIRFIGPMLTARLVNAVERSYQPHNSPRTNYIYAMHALHRVAGVQGLAAISIIKEAWANGSLCPLDNQHEQRGQEPANITHLPTNTIQ